jgi:hypothetical protein
VLSEALRGAKKIGTKEGGLAGREVQSRTS